jgi:hypothetical protein
MMARMTCIGVPYENMGTVVDAGAVAVIYGSVLGLASSPAASSTCQYFWLNN